MKEAVPNWKDDYTEYIGSSGISAIIHDSDFRQSVPFALTVIINSERIFYARSCARIPTNFHPLYLSAMVMLIYLNGRPLNCDFFHLLGYKSQLNLHSYIFVEHTINFVIYLSSLIFS